MQQAAEEPEQQWEWIRQNNMIYAALIAIGVIPVQQFITVTPSPSTGQRRSVWSPSRWRSRC